MRLCFLSILLISYSQVLSAQSVKKELRENRLPLPSAFQVNYKNDTSFSKFADLNPSRIYFLSATIYDMNRLILLHDGSFVCYTENCLRDGMSAGSFKIMSDTLVLNSSIKTFKRLKSKPTIKRHEGGFVVLQNIKYLIKPEGLIALK